MRGRKPVPTALKKLRGNPGKRPLNDAEPKPDVVVPECPDHLSEAARKEWFRITAELKALELITLIDRAALAAYCDAYALWENATIALNRIANTKPKDVGEQRLLYAEECMAYGKRKQGLKEMKAFLVEFGMTPAARSRIRMAPNAGQNTEKPTDKKSPLAEVHELAAG